MSRRWRLGPILCGWAGRPASFLAPERPLERRLGCHCTPSTIAARLSYRTEAAVLSAQISARHFDGQSQVFQEGVFGPSDSTNTFWSDGTATVLWCRR